MLQIYKDSQFDNTKIKNSKIQVQNKTRTLRKYFTCLKRSVHVEDRHININNDNNDDDNNKMIIIIIIIIIITIRVIIKYIYIKKIERERERERENYRHIFEA